MNWMMLLSGLCLTGIIAAAPAIGEPEWKMVWHDEFDKDGQVSMEEVEKLRKYRLSA